MSPMVTAWVVSAVGAVAFFAAGFLFGRARVRQREAEAGVEDGRVRAEAHDRAEALAARVASLEGELQAAQTRILPRPARPPSRPLRSVPRGTNGPRRTSDDLAELLGRMGSGQQMRAVALADELGLPIVGNGEDIASLAAFAGYMADIGRKGRDIVSLGVLRRVTVEDENDTTVTTSIVETGGATLALVTLTDGPGPSFRQSGEVLRSAVSMIQ